MGATRRKSFLAPADNAVLTPAQLARWLQISERQLERRDDIPWVSLGKRTRRVLVRDMITVLQSRARKNGGSGHG